MYKQFDSENTLIIVTSYPDPKKGIRDLNAIAKYAHETTHIFAKIRKTIICAEQLEKKEICQSKNILLARIWQKGNPFSLFSLLFFILKFPKANNILFQFEFNIFGGVLPVIILPFIITLVKIRGKKIYFELHQVVTDVKTLENHIHIRSVFKQYIFNIGLLFFYTSIGLLSEKITVLERELKNRLSRFIDEKKILIFPHCVFRTKFLNQKYAKRKLGIRKDSFTILVFGFINWYKGSDWIVKLFSQTRNRNIQLILAGGKNPTLKNKDYYDRFYQGVLRQAKKNKRIMLTGFVPEDEVSLYFSAADLIVLPYRVFMSASGPFSQALSYKKPVILSEHLFDYTKSDDFTETLYELSLHPNHIFFPYTKHGLASLLKKIQNNKELFEKLVAFSTILGRKRSIDSVIKKYDQLIFEKPNMRKMVRLRMAYNV